MSISRNAVNDVLKEAEAADSATQRLGEKAHSMNGIVELIQEIAEQINLLSLNAAIESARAGDAGRGFSVVASEIKNLASQVQTATTDISKKIASMQLVSSQVVQALGHIGKSVEIVRDSVSTTASAVDEQSYVTVEISSNMEAAYQAVERINANLEIVLNSVQQANTCGVEGKKSYAAVMHA